MVVSRRSIAKVALTAPALVQTIRGGLQSARAGTLTSYDDDVGVASGTPTPDSVVLWTRVPPIGRSAGAASVSYEVATDAEMRQVVARGEVATDADRDFTVKVRVDGLSAFTTYFYRFHCCAWQSVIGRAKTAPALSMRPERLKIAVVSCQKFSAGYYSAYAAMAQEDLDFCLHVGDHIYEKDEGRPGTEEPLGGQEAKTLDDYRAKYRYYLSDPAWREVRRRFTWIDIWDDHEVHNDYNGSVDRPNESARFAAGYQAFVEYMPMDGELTRDSAGVPTLLSYRTFGFGDLVEVFATDQRQFRTPHGCSRNFLTRGCEAMRRPENTMLGATQKAWMMQALGASRATWKLLMSEVVMAPMRVSALFDRQAADVAALAFGERAGFAAPFWLNLDQWDGFPLERQELLRFVQQNVRNLVVLSGDLHATVDSVLYADDEQSSGLGAAVEIATPAITSKTLADRVGATLGGTAQRVLTRSNPHINWLDIHSHGYTVVEASDAALDVRHVKVDTIESPTSAFSVVRRCRIPEGRAEILA